MGRHALARLLPLMPTCATLLLSSWPWFVAADAPSAAAICHVLRIATGVGHVSAPHRGASMCSAIRHRNQQTLASIGASPHLRL